ncbi:TonB-dependent siderophore receptor [Pseudomonas fontis]|uniref:TonB-dependent siderophore receptor n=1 Tax=Pseudomonas fontis TaxID=2942633 RepID=A0ABT5NUT7_9PSED|nr:TonB-dependent siderophore receptor [Pseudomonas fontis]MDD0977165.1 TonB-dependent siderophore receptor [Pseudomonas fontis]MDD0991940.1 TonB-dependent siderophore receptor [Pseudomonas fontis]
MPDIIIRPSLLALAIALGSSAAFPVLAANASTQAGNLQAFDIPAGDLGETLSRIARESGHVLSVRPALLQGRQAPAIRGQMSAEQAAMQALGGSGLNLNTTAGGTWSLVPAGNSAALELGPTQIVERTPENAWGPVKGYVASRSATATKTDTSVLEVPQTINVITQDEIKVRGAQTLTQALRYTPGITGGGFPDRVGLFDEPTSRGFLPTPLYLDGLHLPYGNGSTGGALQIDPYNLERIEVMKGPSSVLYGQNQPGGLVNMVTKRPSTTPVREIVLGGGSYDRRYGAFDYGDRLDEQGTLLYRMVGTFNDENGQIDYVEKKRFMLSPSLTWAPNDQTSLTLYAHYQKDNDVPEAQGLPASGTAKFNPNGKIKRSLFLGEPDVNAYDREQFTVGYELSHELNDVWTLKQNTRYAYVDDRYTAPLHGYRFVTNPQTGQDDQRYATRFGVDWAQHNKVFGVDNMAQARFNTFDVAHTLLIGLDYYHFNSQFLGRYDYNPPIIDLFNPTYGQALNFANPYRWDDTVIQTGLYVQDQLKWDQWFLTVGGRYDWAETDNKVPLAGTHTNSKDEKFTGRAGLGYSFENGVTPYVSYAESFLPLRGTSATGSPFSPSTGKQYEAGVKYQPTGQESFIQLSVYQIDQENILTSNKDNPMFSTQSGAVRSRGVELEGKASLSDNLGLIASVARNDVKYTRDNDGREGRHPAGVAPVTASLWLDYTLKGDTPFAGLGAGIGARYVRGSDGTDTAKDHFTIPSYTVLDGMISYDFAESPLRLKGVKLQVNLQNLEDKTYLSSCQSIWDCYYGEGRTITSNLTYNW